VKDHETYVWEAGFKAFPSSRCKFRKGRDIVERATAAGIGLDRNSDDMGVYFVADAQVQFRVDDIPARGIEIGDKIEVMQPITDNRRDWQSFRIGGTKIAGGIITFTLETVNEQT